MELSMEPNTPRPDIMDGNYHTLGRKTFLLFVLARIHASVVFLFIALGVFIAASDPTVMHALGPKFAPYAGAVAWALLLVFLVLIALTYLVSWLIYANYKFLLGDDALKIQRGVFSKEEVAIPYRQIQDVDIERSLYYRMMGISRLVILTAGHEDPKTNPASEAEGILPAMDSGLAEWLQDTLLKRTDVQRVVAVDEPHQERPGPAGHGPSSPAQPPSASAPGSRN